MTPAKPTAVVLTRFSLRRLVAALRGSARGSIVFYDPYGSLHGPVFGALVRLLGRSGLERTIDVLAGVCGVALRAIPHGDRVPGYAPLQHTAAIDASRLLFETLWSDGGYI